MSGPDESLDTRAPTIGATEPSTVGREGVSYDATEHVGALTQVSMRDPSGIDRYRVGDVIGRGGMGEVVVAYDDRVGRTVALKRMRAGNDGTAARFLREARVQARLEHPAVVPVHDVGLDPEGRPYFT